MVKATDFNKLYEVKKAAIKVIVERGYYGATIAQISKEAGVSDGYLYRHYSGKADLVEDLYIERMGFFQTIILEAIRTKNSIRDILVESDNFLNQTIIDDPNTIAFIFIMDHDHSFEFPDEIRQGFNSIGEGLKSIGLKSLEISTDRSVEEVIAIVFGMPIKLIEMRRKAIVKDDPISHNDINNLVNICLNALK